MITVTARAKAKKGSEIKLHEILIGVAKETRTESGCVSYQVYFDSNDATLVLVHELWKSEKDMQEHLQKPYVLRLFSMVPELCDGMPELKTWTLLE